MIEIRYDPFDGKAIPDGKVAETVDSIIYFCTSQIQRGAKEPNFRKGDNTRFSTENVFNSLLVAVKEGRINYEHIVFKFHIPGKSYWELDTIKIDRDGKISHQPEGFLDYSEKYLTKLMGF